MNAGNGSGTDTVARPQTLTDAEIEAFITDGFVHVAGAFPREIAQQCRTRLWSETGVDPTDRSTWTRPVIRIPPIGDSPFPESCNSPRLQGAYDQLFGVGRWEEPDCPGTFPVRFPHIDEPNDDDWHFDAGWHTDANWMSDLEEHEVSDIDASGFRYNIHSRGRGLLLLLLYSDVTEWDAPTIIRVGSHLDVAPSLAPFGEQGRPLYPGAELDALTGRRPEAMACGEAGDAYLVHPFVVHRSQAHRGSNPRFMAQDGLEPREELTFDRPEGDLSPVEVAVVRALEAAGTALPVR